MTSKLPILLLSLLPLGTSIGFGQASDEEPEVSVEFSAVAWKNSIHEPLYFMQGSDYVPIRMTTRARSKHFTYVGSNPLVFYTKQDSETYAPVAQTVVPTNLSKALFVFAAQGRPDTAERYRVITINDDEALFPRDSYRFVNWTSDRIFGKLGDETFAVPAQSAETVIPPQTDDNELFLQLAELTADRPRLIYSKIWPFQPNTRKLVILLPPDPGKMGKVSIVILSEYVPESG